MFKNTGRQIVELGDMGRSIASKTAQTISNTLVNRSMEKLDVAWLLRPTYFLATRCAGGDFRLLVFFVYMMISMRWTSFMEWISYNYYRRIRRMTDVEIERMIEGDDGEVDNFVFDVDAEFYSPEDEEVR